MGLVANGMGQHDSTPALMVPIRETLLGGGSLRGSTVSAHTVLENRSRATPQGKELGARD